MPTGTAWVALPRLTFTGAAPAAANGPGQPCPGTAPVRHHDVSVLTATLPIPGGDPFGVVYALSADVAAIGAGTKPIEPLALRTAAGECIEIAVTNLTGRRASLPSGLVADVASPGGSFRELVALFHDADDRIGRSDMPYERAVTKPTNQRVSLRGAGG